ncbi:lambda-exonuclease family protein [Photobacterium sp. 1_MG-2023]|uniref:lambda-exonuclease family protein n=1 Tax=Photobacterium sp. 1_MG-2023 TaxID=3062646 RepID=UPI0026E1FCE4|nr:YqaJ viral recombinase family protein [Photobacterium sp. 1_MG-2023]MDO6706750.1 YqaJ viral recombinase family protein [Photobacterium sp. 1_MG-2023]
MKVINVTQGSQEWHALRQTKMTASEAPAMMNASKYMSRAELLRIKATGVTPEVSPAQQRIFDKGHAAEEAARPHVEVIIGEELFPATAISDEHDWMLASFDGVTMLDDVVFEHKLWNENLALAVASNELEPHYYWQLEQQLLVSGADKAIFVCSDLTDGSEPDEGENFIFCWYESRTERRAALIAGWQQFMTDLDGYQPEPEKETVEAEAIRELPAISYRMNGLSLTSNLNVFKEAAESLVEKSKQPIKTDQDFANAESMVKVFKGAEDKINSLADQVLGEVQDIDTFVKDLKFIGEQIRQARLATDKQVKARKEQIRKEILKKAIDEIHQHRIALNTEINAQLPEVTVSVTDAMKGKKSVSSLKDAAAAAVAEAKVEANQHHQRAMGNKGYLESTAGDYQFLFNDWPQIAFLEPLAFQYELEHRITTHLNNFISENNSFQPDKFTEPLNKAVVCHISVEKALNQKQDKSHTNSTMKSSPKKTVKTIQIPISEEKYLRYRNEILTALENSGVKKWSGYVSAISEIEKKNNSICHTENFDSHITYSHIT